MLTLKNLDKVILLVIFTININVFSQIRMSNIEGIKFTVNSKTENNNIIKIFDNDDYDVYYVLDRRDFDLKKGLGTNGIAKTIFFSKKYKKGILINFKQMIYRLNKNIYEINLHTGSHDKYMFNSFMAIVDKNFKYEYFVVYHYMPPPPSEKGEYKSWITVQNTDNYCNMQDFDLQDIIINENVDDLLNNILKMSTDELEDGCSRIISDIDFKEFFSKKIIK